MGGGLTLISLSVFFFNGVRTRAHVHARTLFIHGGFRKAYFEFFWTKRRGGGGGGGGVG